MSVDADTMLNVMTDKTWSILRIWHPLGNLGAKT